MSIGISLPITHIEAKPDTGAPRIIGTGILVEFVGQLYFTQAWSVERICETYQLSQGQVLAALSYYADHREELDQAAREAEERLDRRYQEHPELDATRQKILARGRQRRSNTP